MTRKILIHRILAFLELIESQGFPLDSPDGPLDIVSSALAKEPVYGTRNHPESHAQRVLLDWFDHYRHYFVDCRGLDQYSLFLQLLQTHRKAIPKAI